MTPGRRSAGPPRGRRSDRGPQRHRVATVVMGTGRPHRLTGLPGDHHHHVVLALAVDRDHPWTSSRSPARSPSGRSRRPGLARVPHGVPAVGATTPRAAQAEHHHDQPGSVAGAPRHGHRSDLTRPQTGGWPASPCGERSLGTMTAWSSCWRISSAVSSAVWREVSSHRPTWIVCSTACLRTCGVSVGV